MILEKYGHLHGQLPYLPHLIILSSFMVGIVVGLMISTLILQNHKQCKVQYISHDEILKLEHARIARTKQQKLFYGKDREAIRLIEKFAKHRANSDTHIVFTKGAFVRGSNTTSISEEIYNEVMRTLREKASNNSKQDDEKEDEISSYYRPTSSPAMKLLEKFKHSEK
jgi:hypothetical protein